MGRRWTARAAVGATYRRLARKFMHRGSKRERPFYAAVARFGALPRGCAPLLSRPSVQTMATGQLIQGQKAVSGFFPGDGGNPVSVVLPGVDASWGWDGPVGRAQRAAGEAVQPAVGLSRRAGPAWQAGQSGPSVRHRCPCAGPPPGS